MVDLPDAEIPVIRIVPTLNWRSSPENVPKMFFRNGLFLINHYEGTSSKDTFVIGCCHAISHLNLSICRGVDMPFRTY